MLYIVVCGQQGLLTIIIMVRINQIKCTKLGLFNSHICEFVAFVVVKLW